VASIVSGSATLATGYIAVKLKCLHPFLAAAAEERAAMEASAAEEVARLQKALEDAKASAAAREKALKVSRSTSSHVSSNMEHRLWQLCMWSELLCQK
jgi:7-keto-8-aminopelargonate synthetase-like enzyme